MFEKPVLTALSTVVTVPSATGERHRYGGTLPRCELVYKISGHTLTRFGQKELDYTEGVLAFLPAGVPDNEYTAHTLETGSCFNVHFQMEEPFPKEAVLWNFAGDETVHSLFRRLYRLWLLREDGYYCRCMALLYQIFAELQKSGRTAQSAGHREKIRPAMEYLELHCFDSKFNYACLPVLCKMSYSYFKRLFVDCCRMSPSRYITLLKMNTACELLTFGTDSVSAIAERLGYENVYYFSRVFRREVGCPPSQYRKTKTPGEALSSGKKG